MSMAATVRSSVMENSSVYKKYHENQLTLQYNGVEAEEARQCHVIKLISFPALHSKNSGKESSVAVRATRSQCDHVVLTYLLQT